VKLTLTPLKKFNKILTVLLAREFEEADLNALMAFYDTLITLGQDWKLILDEVVLKANDIFPTFYSDSQANSQKVELLLFQKRGELAAARKVPLTRVGPLGAAMSSKGPQLLVLVVIPESVQMKS